MPPHLSIRSGRGLPVTLVLAAAAIVAHVRGLPARADEKPAPTVAPPAAPAQRYCPLCGAANRMDSRFCLKDGTPLPAFDPGRYVRGFERATATLSPEEIQKVMEGIARSVVRIRARPRTTYKFPVCYWKDAEAEYFGRAMLGKLETSDLDARLAGSGFAIGEPGEIVTNAHVAAPAGLEADLTIETSDGRTFKARLVGADAASDLALLRTDTEGIPRLLWGQSVAIRAGQETWAIGNPLDIGISVARGTVSGLVGMRMGLNQVEAFLHSDAHITHGNSGGPLVDVAGRVQGVSDMIASEGKGQGYFIPEMMARLVIGRLRKDGRYERGFLGLHARPVDSDLITRFALKRTEGTVVEEVLPDTPAQRAGFQPGDVLFGVNGREAGSSYLLQEAISSLGPGAPARIALDRGGEIREIQVTTRLRPEAPRIDPLKDLQRYLRVQFQEDLKKGQVIVGNKQRSRRAPGLYDGFRVKSVLPGEDWPEEPITLNYYKTRARPVAIGSLADLRAALNRCYVGGRMAITFEIDYPRAPIVSVAFDELWPIIL
jgi:S1-C subfamily serine protease